MTFDCVTIAISSCGYASLNMSHPRPAHALFEAPLARYLRYRARELGIGLGEEQRVWILDKVSYRLNVGNGELMRSRRTCLACHCAPPSPQADLDQIHR
jgi:hypothetical protein